MSGGKTDVYIIPPNFAEEGTLFSGRVRTRNAVETAVLVFFLLQALFSFNIGTEVRIYVGVIVLIPVTVLSLLGVQGESLSMFIVHFIRYLFRRQLLTVPTQRHRLERNRRFRKRRQRLSGKRYRRGGARNGKRSKGASA